MRTQPTLTSRNGGRAVRVGRGAMRAWAAYFVIHRGCCINPPDSGHLRAARDCLKRTFMTDRKVADSVEKLHFARWRNSPRALGDSQGQLERPAASPIATLKQDFLSGSYPAVCWKRRWPYQAGIFSRIVQTKFFNRIGRVRVYAAVRCLAGRLKR